MHLICLTYQISQRNLAYLKCAQNFYISRQLGKIIFRSLPSLTRKHCTVYCQPGKTSKFEVHFLLSEYHFCTIVEWKNLKLKHCKLRTFCIGFIHSLSMGYWYNVKRDKTPSCLWRHEMLSIFETKESHRRQNSIGEEQAYPSYSHTGSTLNSFTPSAICSMSKTLLSSSHALIYCWIIKPNCFIYKEFVFTGYIVHFKGTTILSSIYFPSSHSVVLKPQ